MARFPPARWECLPIEELDRLTATRATEPGSPAQAKIFAAAYMAIR
jgi:hypothetical protein